MMFSVFQTPTPWHALLASVTFHFANTLPLSVLPALNRRWACRFYHYQHPDGSCEDNSDVERLSSTVAAAFMSLFCLFSFLSVSFMSHLLHDWGRKMIMAVVASVMTCSSVLTCVALITMSPILVPIMILMVAFDGMFGIFLFTLAVQNYIVDTVDKDARATYFSFEKGFNFVLIAVATSLGGWIYDKTGNLTSPFIVATVAWATLALYTVFIMPESLTSEERKKRKVNPSTSSPLSGNGAAGTAAESKTNKTLWMRLKESDARKNLSSFLPQKLEDGGSDWRIVGATVGYAVLNLTDGFFIYLVSFYATGRLQLSASRLGFVITFWLTVNALNLVAIFPFIKGLARRRADVSPATQTDSALSLLSGEATESTPLLDDIEENPDQLPSEVSKDANGPIEAHEFDRAFGCFSYLLRMVGLIWIGNSTSWQGLVVGLGLSGLSTGSGPAIQAYMTCLVRRPDRLLAGLQMLDTLGLAISPLIMSSIYGATLDSSPAFPFYLSAAAYAIATIATALPSDPVRNRKKGENIGSVTESAC
ncbi:MFS general substrate transporter [Atractiella rhizophila]|nr:MFS general substrate transporter [Atractiella rhizophila]